MCFLYLFNKLLLFVWSGGGNGNPLQCSCLGGAWWAAVYGVAQTQTRLKWLSSSSISSLWSVNLRSPLLSVLKQTANTISAVDVQGEIQSRPQNQDSWNSVIPSTSYKNILLLQKESRRNTQCASFREADSAHKNLESVSQHGLQSHCISMIVNASIV